MQSEHDIVSVCGMHGGTIARTLPMTACIKPLQELSQTCSTGCHSLYSNSGRTALSSLQILSTISVADSYVCHFRWNDHSYIDLFLDSDFPDFKGTLDAEMLTT